MRKSFPRSPNHPGLKLLLAVPLLIVSAKPFAAATTYCSDLTAVSATSGWSTVQKDQSIDQKPITLGGKVYPKGLGTHAPSEIVYNLAGKYATFSADVGIDDETAGKGSVEFEVLADDSLLYKSDVIKGKMAAGKISVVVAGKNTLKLVTTIGPDTYDMDDADWAGASLTGKDAAAIGLGNSSATHGFPATRLAGPELMPSGAVGFPSGPSDGRVGGRTGGVHDLHGRLIKNPEPGLLGD